MLATITVYKHWAISFLGVCAPREIGAQTSKKQMIQCLYTVIVASMRHWAKVLAQCLMLATTTIYKHWGISFWGVCGKT